LWPIKNAEAFNKGTVKEFAAVGVAAVDAHTLRIQLERPTPYLPALTTHATWMPVPRATIEKFGQVDDRANPWTRPGNLVGNGPFTLTEWQPNSRIVVTENPRYWDTAHTHLNSVVFFPIESADTEERDYRAGQLHLTYDIPVSKVAFYRAQALSPFRNDLLLDLLYIN